MILAAGLGRRMRPLTDHTPKPLLPVAGKPLLVYHIEKLRALGVTELVINIAYLGEKIRAALGDGSELGVSITYSVEVEPLETAGAINQALPLLGSEPFLLINGDVWSDYPIAPLLSLNLAGTQLGHLVMVNNPDYRAAGDFAVSESATAASGLLLPRDDKQAGYTFSGISLIRPELVSQYPELRERFALREVFDWAMGQQRLTAEVYTGEWWDVGTPERLHALDQQLSQRA